MEITEFLKITLIFFLILFSGFFSGSEASLFSLTLVQRERIKKKTKKKSRLIEALLKKPKQLIITILVGNDMVNIAASVLATGIFVSYFDDMGKWITIAVMTPVTLIFAETIPKTLSVANNEKTASFVARPLSAFSKLITPLIWFFDVTADTIIKIIGVYRQDKEHVIMEDDFRDMVDLSHSKGEIERRERDLIHNVFEFSDTQLYEVMTPLKKIISIPENLEISETFKRIEDSRHSRIPTYSGKKSNITGILYAKDLMKVDRGELNNKKKVTMLIRNPIYVPDDRKVDEIFYSLKDKRTHIAICHNKNGEVSGLVTMEDLLEELFGEIYDEYDQEVL